MFGHFRRMLTILPHTSYSGSLQFSTLPGGSKNIVRPPRRHEMRFQPANSHSSTATASGNRQSSSILRAENPRYRYPRGIVKCVFEEVEKKSGCNSRNRGMCE